MSREAVSSRSRPGAWRPLAQPVLVLLVLAGVGYSPNRRGREETSRKPTPERPKPVVTASVEPRAPAAPTPPVPAPRVEPPAPEPDPAVIAAAEEAIDAASRDRARADDRAARAQRDLERAQLEVADSIRAYRTAGLRLRDPAPAMGSLRSRGAVLQTEVKSLEGELNVLAQAPKPRKRPLLDRSPVAQVVEGQEYHFELRQGRVTYIDLDRLVAKVKADAELQLRMAAGRLGSRPILSTVGPIGEFSMRYELGRELPSSLDAMLQNAGQVTYTLAGWELVPKRAIRGESSEALQHPASNFTRAVNSLNPEYATVTLWVYPDSFSLFRQVREWLRDRGFMVAARPLPEGMAIRGSPGGSMSAGQ